MLSSPHVKKRARLWWNGNFYQPPQYFEQAYANFLRQEAEDKKRIEAGTIQFTPGQMGPEIRKRIENWGSDTSKPFKMEFAFDLNANVPGTVKERLKMEGFKVSGWATRLFGQKEMEVDDNALTGLADELAALAGTEGGKLDYCRVTLPEKEEPVKTNEPVKLKKPWWKVW